MTMTTPTYGRPTRPQRLLAAARHDPLLTIGLGIVALSIFLALFGTVIAPKSPTEPTGAPSEHPSLSHWMGTDASGLDVFSQVISAPRTDVVLAVSAALVSSVLGTLIGLTAGYFRTWWAEVVMRISDVIQAFPVFSLGMMLVALSGRNTGNLIVALSLLYTPIFIRLTRAEVLTQRNRSYVESARDGELRMEDRVSPCTPELTRTVIDPTLCHRGVRHLADRRPLLRWGWCSTANAGVGPDDLLKRQPVDPRRMVAVGVSRPRDLVHRLRVRRRRQCHRTTGRRMTDVLTPVSPIEQDVVLEARGVGVSYGAGTNAVSGFDLRIHRGEIVGLIGESGCGKTSAALALMGLARHPGRVTGSVLYDNRNLLDLSDAELREIRGRTIGLITQKPRQSLNPLLTIGTQISRVFRAHNRATRQEAQAHAIELLEAVGINDASRRLTAYPHELSGGMAQRALISMAMSSRPRLLIADEPTSGLDVTIQAQFLDRMWERAQVTGSAVLLVTQDLGIIANYCDRIVVMAEGRVIEERTVRDFFVAPQQEYSKSLLAVSAERTDSPATRRSDERTALVDVKGLSKHFVLPDRRRLQAVQDVDLVIPAGHAVGLVGESGSGKTTVGRLLVRLLEPDAGTVLFAGRDITALDSKAFRPQRARMQIVFQDPFDSLNPRWTVNRIVREPLDLHDLGHGEQTSKLTDEDKRRRIVELLELVGLGRDVGDRKAAALSSGEQQRVCLARALATQPEFLVLDEPTSALPPAARVEMVRLLADLRQRLGIAYLFISHDLWTVSQVCDEVAVMYLSQIVEQGTRAQVFEHPAHPYTQALLDSVLMPDPTDRRVDRERKDLSGEIPSPVDLPAGCYLAGRCPLVESRCREERQDLVTMDDGRSVRCWKVAPVAGRVR